MRKNYKKPGFERKFQRKPRGEYRHHDQLAETDVGITEYLNPHEGFKGIIKHRFADFQVNEVGLDGSITKLTNTSIPAAFKDQANNDQDDYKTVEKSPLEVLPQEHWEKLRHMADNKATDVESIYLDVEDLSKDARIKLHDVVKKYFKRIITSNTKKVDDRHKMEFSLLKNCSTDRFDWPKDLGDYVHFLLYKECLDTIDATFKLASATKLPAERFSYAGVKDRRAKTTQWCSIKRVPPWKLIAKTRNLHNIFIGNIECKYEQIKLGDLLGNQFRIAIRNVTANDDLICKCVSYVKEHGYVNYYGLQRFGNDREAPTYLVGIYLLCGKFKEAVELILKPKKSDDPDEKLTHAKEEYARSKDAVKASKLLAGRPGTVEEKLIKALEKNGKNDYVNALEQIPRNARLLYINSFQSLIWNKMASKRLTEFGHKPVIGDLVLSGDIKVDGTCLDLDETNADTDQNTENGEVDSDLVVEESSESENKRVKDNVIVLTEDNVEQYTIFDVVLPLPGYNIQYPDHMKEFYKTALEEHGLSLEMPKQKVKCYNLSGTYRKIMEMPKDLKWEIVHYNESNQDLIYSDLDELKHKPKPKFVASGTNKAFIVSFILPPAGYATMVLREILKTDTSASAHAKLSESSNSNEKKKRITAANIEATNEVEDEVLGETSNSLLANKDKYAQFMNSILQSTPDSEGVKRKLEGEEVDGSKKIKVGDGSQ